MTDDMQMKFSWTSAVDIGKEKNDKLGEWSCKKTALFCYLLYNKKI